MTVKYADVWNLDTIFPGGTSESAAFFAHLEETEAVIAAFKKEVEAAKQAGDESPALWADFVERAQEVEKHVREASAFMSCLTAQDVTDDQAKILSGRVKTLSASYQAVMTTIDEQLLAFNEEQWETFTSQPGMEHILYNLNEAQLFN